MSLAFPDGATRVVSPLGTEKLFAARASDGKILYMAFSDIASMFVSTNTLLNYQQSLISGNNIKTIGGQSLLGAGELDLTNVLKITYWSAKVWPALAQVNYLGQDWVASSITAATDIPGTSLLWVNRLWAYNGIQTIQTSNLFNYRTLTSGYITSVGATASNAAFRRTSFIAVKPSTEYSIWDTDPAILLQKFAIYYYDSARVFISSSASSGAISPSNAAYCRFSINRITTINNGMMLIEGATKPELFISYGYKFDTTATIPIVITKEDIINPLKELGNEITTTISTIDSFLAPRQTTFLKIGKNKYNKAENLSSRAISNTTGSSSSASGFTTSGYLPVIAGMSYIFTNGDRATLVSGFPFAVWYKSDKTYLSAALVENNIWVAPADAAFMRVSVQTAGLTGLIMFIEGTNSPLAYSDFGYELDSSQILVPTEVKTWQNKNWCALGDSITAQNMYRAQLCATTGLIQTVQRGQTGALLRTRADSLTVEDLANIDIVTVLAGTNDYGHGGSRIGTIDDGKEIDTIYGSTAYVIDKILTLKPTVRLVFFTPLNRGYYSTEPNYTPPAANGNGLTLSNISEAIQAKCRIMGIPCFDLYSRSGLNTYNFSLYTADGLHPNSTFADKMGVLMGKFINTINL